MTGILSQATTSLNAFCHYLSSGASTVFSVNYEIVSSIIHVLTSVWWTAVAIFTTVSNVCTSVAVFIIDLLEELFNLACLLVWIVQSVCKIVIRVVSLGEYLFYPLEVLLFYAYVGIRLILSGSWTCVMYLLTAVLSSVELTYAGVRLGLGQMFDSFDKLGSSVIWVIENLRQSVVDGATNACCEIYTLLGNVITSILQATKSGLFELGRFWANLYTSMGESLTPESYFGIFVVIVVYIITIWLRKFIGEYGLTFPPVFQFGEVNENVPAPADHSDDSSDTMSVASVDSDISDFADDSDVEEIVSVLSSRNLNQRPPTPCKLGISRSTKDLEIELEAERDKRMCVVCQDQVKNVLLLPCRHLCACVDCAQQLLRTVDLNRRVCPLCRSRIKGRIDVFT